MIYKDQTQTVVESIRNHYKMQLKALVLLASVCLAHGRGSGSGKENEAERHNKQGHKEDFEGQQKNQAVAKSSTDCTSSTVEIAMAQVATPTVVPIPTTTCDSTTEAPIITTAAPIITSETPCTSSSYVAPVKTTPPVYVDPVITTPPVYVDPIPTTTPCDESSTVAPVITTTPAVENAYLTVDSYWTTVSTWDEPVIATEVPTYGSEEMAPILSSAHVVYHGLVSGALSLVFLLFA